MHDPRFHTRTLSEEERHGLILEHLPQVRLLARRIHGRLPESVSLDDLVSTGIVGLISAVDRFDPSRHVQLRAYAEHKIKGGILDSLRCLDWASRQQRRRSKQVEAGIAALEQRLHRAPTEQEIAAALNLTIDRYREWQVGLRGLNPRVFDPTGPDDSEKRDPRELPSAAVERSELQRALAVAISGLPEIHQIVISLYYRDERTQQEIAKIVGLHQSRISQLMAQAIRRLRAYMAQLWPTGGRRAKRSKRLGC